jgi:hypothetical protein
MMNYFLSRGNPSPSLLVTQEQGNRYTPINERIRGDIERRISQRPEGERGPARLVRPTKTDYRQGD